MTLAADPFQVSRELSGPTKPPRCGGPLPTRRHHFVYRVTAGGAEPSVTFACAHCGFAPKPSHIEVELTEADARRMAAQSRAAHEADCPSIRPKTAWKPELGPGRRAPARRLHR